MLVAEISCCFLASECLFSPACHVTKEDKRSSTSRVFFRFSACAILTWLETPGGARRNITKGHGQFGLSSEFLLVSFDFARDFSFAWRLAAPRSLRMVQFALTFNSSVRASSEPLAIFFIVCNRMVGHNSELTFFAAACQVKWYDVVLS